MGKGTKSKGGNKTGSSSLTAPGGGNKPTDKDGGLPPNLLTEPKKAGFYKPCRLETLLQGYIWVLHDFFSANECQSWIGYLENQSQMDLVQQRGTRYLAHRECYRFSRDDTIMAHRLFERLVSVSPDLMAMLPVVPGQQPVTCNPNLRLYKYIKGQSFGQHIDESCMVKGIGETRITILIYLSSCQGGATRFEKDVAFAPRAGSMLLHVHGDDCLLHEGEAVQSGIKYILRTDLVYAKV